MRIQRIKKWTASPRTLHIVNIIAIACLMVFILWLMLWVLQLSNQATIAQSQRSALTATNARQDAALDEANRKIVAAGGTPVEVPQTVQGIQGVQGQQGTQGIQGPTGAPGRDGADATPAQVSQAVNAYCSDHGDCTGPQGTPGEDGTNGADGKNGANGKDSTIPGPAGAKGDTGATGKTGPAGTDGKNGADGADGANAYPFTFTFTTPARGPLGTARTYTCTVTDPSTTATCSEGS